jgi:Uma2 family endonuclease
MSVATEPTRPAEKASPCDHPYRFTTDRYYQLVATGFFGEKAPLFLWKGRIVEKMTKGRRHARATTKIDKALSRIVPDGWHVEQEQPMEVADDGVPEPDLMVVRGTEDDYPDRPPTARDVSLLVEVADSSLPEDRGDVLETYATEGIPVYWIVNLRHRWVEVYTEPSGPADPPSYRACRQYMPGEEIPVVLDGREVGRVAVRDILP